MLNFSILVFNAGSSSLKFAIYETQVAGDMRLVIRGVVSHIGVMASLHWSDGITGAHINVEAKNHQQAAEWVLDWLQHLWPFGSLLERLVMEFNDAGVRPRLRLALADDGRRAVDGVALEQRIAELDVGHSEIGDGRADRHVGHLDADHQAEREQRVHQRLAPFGLGLAEMSVDMQRLRIERHVGKQHVVHLRDGTGVTVLVKLADLHILEIKAAALVPLYRFRHSPVSNLLSGS